MEVSVHKKSLEIDLSEMFESKIGTQAIVKVSAVVAVSLARISMGGLLAEVVEAEAEGRQRDWPNLLPVVSPFRC